jgi:putative Mg2+ transporter-C (MgtC) family protein
MSVVNHRKRRRGGVRPVDNASHEHAGPRIVVRVGLATALGLPIGIERQWRSRMAGLQTMALVSMGSALFVILGAYGFERDVDPTRVVAQIVTGVGFLGAGVIMKQGSSVVGLNTAATLWATAAVGALAGAWAWREAVAGAVIIIAANGFLYPLAARMDRFHSEVGREVQHADYTLEVECERNAVPAVRSMIVDALTGPTLQVKALGWRNAETPEEVVLSADVSVTKRDDSHLEKAVRAVSGEPSVRVVRWSAKDEAAADWGRRASG